MLSKLNIDFIKTPNLVRGLDYYNDFCFEFVIRKNRDKAQSAIIGGG